MSRQLRFRIQKKNLFDLLICIALAFVFVLLSSGVAFGQGNVGINNLTPHAKSLLDLTSTDKGLLTPRMTAAQRTAMFPAPDATGEGMLVYQTDGTQGFYYYDGAAWVMVQSGGAGWGLLGNAGTNPATHFLGTTDNQGMAIRTNNIERVRIANNGEVTMGDAVSWPGYRLGVIANSINPAGAFQNTNATGYSGLHFINNTGVARAHIGAGNASSPNWANMGYTGTYTAHPFVLTTSDLERMRIAANGNVGIGHNNPAYNLDIKAATQAVTRLTSQNHIWGSVLVLDNTTPGSNALGAINFGDGISAWGQLNYHMTNGMTLSSGGAERMRVAVNGNVGIGTTAPYRLLEVASATQGVQRISSANAVNGSVLELRNTSAGNNNLGAINFLDGVGTRGQLSYHFTDGMTFNTAGAERMRIDLTGNVGIGTTAPASNLHVSKASSGITPNANAVATMEGSGNTYQHFLTTTGESGLLFGSAGTAITGGVLHNTGFAPSGFELRAGGNTQRMTMTSNGHTTFGDGIHWPAMRLGVVNNSASAAVGSLNQNTSGWSGYLASRSDFGGSAYLGFGNASHATLANVGFAGTGTGHPFAFITSNVERMRIDANGNVGIGTNAPFFPLDMQTATQAVARLTSLNHVNGSVLVLNNTTVGNNNLGAVNFGDGATTWGQLSYHLTSGMTFRTNNAERMRIDVNGNVGIGTAAPTSALEVNGFTKLGSNAPAIKQIELAGTTAATEGNFVDIAHGLTAAKIISVQVLIEYTAGNWIPSGYTINPEYLADYVIGATNIRLYNHNGSSGSILSKPVKVLVTYKA